MLAPDREEIAKMIAQAISAPEARINGLAGVVQNIVAVQQDHAYLRVPSTTTDITTGATTLGSISNTVAGPGNFRYLVSGSLNALSTTPATLTGVFTWDLNGTNTIQAFIQFLLSTPTNFTSSPTVGQFVFPADLSYFASLASNTSVWRTPVPGQTVNLTFGLAASATGASVPPNNVVLSSQEIF